MEKPLFNLSYPNNMFYNAYVRNCANQKLSSIYFTKLEPNLHRAYLITMHHESTFFTEDERFILSKIYKNNLTEIITGNMMEKSQKYVNTTKYSALDKLYSTFLIVNAYNVDGVRIIKLLSEVDIDKTTEYTKHLVRNIPLYYIESLLSARFYNLLMKLSAVCLNDLQNTTYYELESRGVCDNVLREIQKYIKLADIKFGRY